MSTRWQRLANLLQLVRVELAFGAISNAWLIIFLCHSGVEPPGGRYPGLMAWSLGAALALGAVVAGGLHAYGMALNDAVDARHDRAFYPQRPIAAGRVGLPAAVLLSITAVLAALLAAVLLGTGPAIVCLIAAASVLFYNATAKFFPAVGILTLGVVRAMNMFIPNPFLSFAWPIWLTMTHVVICAAIAHRLESKRPRLHASELWVLCGGWVFWTLALLGWMAWRQRDLVGAGQGRWLGPAFAVALFGAAVWLQLRGRLRPLRSRRAAGAAFMRLAMLWLIVYDASWLLSAGLYWQAGVHGALFIVAVASIRPLDGLVEARGTGPVYRWRLG